MQRLLFKLGDIEDIIAYTDANWGCDPNDKESIGGYYIHYAGNLIFKSAKDHFVDTRLSKKFEDKDLANACTELAWSSSLLDELKTPKHITPIIRSDNSCAISLAANLVYHGRTKHREIKKTFHLQQSKS